MWKNQGLVTPCDPNTETRTTWWGSGRAGQSRVWAHGLSQSPSHIPDTHTHTRARTDIGRGGLLLATRVYCHEGSLECLRVGQGQPPPCLGRGISARGCLQGRTQDAVPWELEGRGRPAWVGLGSGLLGPRVSPVSGHTLAWAPDPALTCAEKGLCGAPEVAACTQGSRVGMSLALTRRLAVVSTVLGHPGAQGAGSLAAAPLPAPVWVFRMLEALYTFVQIHKYRKPRAPYMGAEGTHLCPRDSLGLAKLSQTRGREAKDTGDSSSRVPQAMP